MNKFSQKLDNFFEISARNSTIKTEIMGGLTTFFAMCYIMLVNPSQMVGFLQFEGFPGAQQVWNAVYIATALGAIVGTLLMALYAKMPFAQASGMGLNSFFFVSFMVNGFGNAVSVFAPGGDIKASFAAGLSIIFVAGLVFMFLSVTGLRKKITESLPSCLKRAIPAGIGLFIAFIGLKNAGIVQFNQYTFVQAGNWNIFNGLNGIIVPMEVIDPATGELIKISGIQSVPVTWYSIAPAIAALIGVLLIAALSRTKLAKANVIIGIIATTCLYYLFNIGNDAAFQISMINPGDTFRDFGELGVQGWYKGFSYWTGEAVLQAILLVITFCLVDMFDTLGTLQGTAAEANMLDENGNPKNLNKCLMSDSAATVVGSMMGTSTVTTFVESAAGVSAGARTGLSSVVVAFMFFIAMFLSPLAAVIPGAATAPALIYVGVLMMKNFKEVDFSDLTTAVPAFLTLLMMPLTYSISNGIAFGMISYMALKLFKVFFTNEIKVSEYFAIATKKNGKTTGEFFSKDIVVFIIGALFLVRFFMVTM